MENMDAELSLRQALISIQVVAIDFYMLWLPEPREFVEALDTALPVIRIFGSTERGQRSLIHVHGVFPYLYFRPVEPYDDSFSTEEKVRGKSKASR